jgi:murein DD-endopeptidase MepM/ murein hydrolase activator NlpD
MCGVNHPITIDGIPVRVLEFPLRGEWQAVNTPAFRIPSHGTNKYAQRYAYDFVQIDEQDNPISRLHFWRYFLAAPAVDIVYGWNAPVHAPAAGKIADIGDGWADKERINFFIDYFSSIVFPPRLSHGDLRVLAGNYVTIETEFGHVFLAHLRNGTLNVQVGQCVLAGDVIGCVGNSGNTMIPHLHIQMMDGSDPRRANALPCYFSSVEEWIGSGWRPLVNQAPERLQRIRRAAGVDDAPSRPS